MNRFTRVVRAGRTYKILSLVVNTGMHSSSTICTVEWNKDQGEYSSSSRPKPDGFAQYFFLPTDIVQLVISRDALDLAPPSALKSHQWQTCAEDASNGGVTLVAAAQLIHAIFSTRLYDSESLRRCQRYSAPTAEVESWSREVLVATLAIPSRRLFAVSLEGWNAAAQTMLDPHGEWHPEHPSSSSYFCTVAACAVGFASAWITITAGRSGSSDAALVVWNAWIERCESQFRGHLDGLSAVAQAPPNPPMGTFERLGIEPGAARELSVVFERTFAAVARHMQMLFARAILSTGQCVLQYAMQHAAIRLAAAEEVTRRRSAIVAYVPKPHRNELRRAVRACDVDAMLALCDAVVQHATSLGQSNVASEALSARRSVCRTRDAAAYAEKGPQSSVPLPEGFAYMRVCIWAANRSRVPGACEIDEQLGRDGAKVLDSIHGARKAISTEERLDARHSGRVEPSLYIALGSNMPVHAAARRHENEEARAAKRARRNPKLGDDAEIKSDSHVLNQLWMDYTLTFAWEMKVQHHRLCPTKELVDGVPADALIFDALVGAAMNDNVLALTREPSVRSALPILSM